MKKISNELASELLDIIMQYRRYLETETTINAIIKADNIVKGNELEQGDRCYRLDRLI